MVTLNINGASHDVAMDADTPLLWALRDGLLLNGTKYGCGIAQCGACIVLVDGQPVRSCVTPLSSLSGKKITTIEGLSKDRSHPVQQAWIAEQVPQCGYCQSGQILAVTALLEKIPQPTDADIDDAMAGVLCRCGTYPRIRKAIRTAAELSGNKARGV
jgi:aerobic-type carbon monoxide dehydrogenase small subunit (CoxS/CutS family)